MGEEKEKRRKRIGGERTEDRAGAAARRVLQFILRPVEAFTAMISRTSTLHRGGEFQDASSELRASSFELRSWCDGECGVVAHWVHNQLT